MKRYNAPTFDISGTLVRRTREKVTRGNREEMEEWDGGTANWNLGPALGLACGWMGRKRVRGERLEGRVGLLEYKNMS